MAVGTRTVAAVPSGEVSMFSPEFLGRASVFSSLVEGALMLTAHTL